LSGAGIVILTKAVTGPSSRVERARTGHGFEVRDGAGGPLPGERFGRTRRFPAHRARRLDRFRRSRRLSRARPATAHPEHHPDESATVARARARGLRIEPLTPMRVLTPGPPSVIIGYATRSPDRLRAAVRLLARSVLP
jgi:hypothetical protein